MAVLCHLFYGDEIRIQDDSMPTTHVALAVEGVSWSAQIFVASVANGIVGTWDRSVGIGSTLHRHWLLLLQLEDQEKPQLRIHICLYHPAQIQGCWGLFYCR